MLQKLRLDWAVLLVFVLALSACEGCTNLKGPSEVAETSEQQAYALYGQFVIAEEAAAGIVEDPGTPQEVRETIAQADAIAKDVADDLLAASRSVMRIRAEIAAGKSTEEKLNLAIINLDKWVAEAKPKIQALVSSLSGKSD